jgi:hypothetical protein
MAALMMGKYHGKGIVTQKNSMKLHQQNNKKKKKKKKKKKRRVYLLLINSFLFISARVFYHHTRNLHLKPFAFAYRGSQEQKRPYRQSLFTCWCYQNPLTSHSPKHFLENKTCSKEPCFFLSLFLSLVDITENNGRKEAIA